MNHSIRVVNKRTSDYDVYIGRGSVWGNPFRLAPGHTEADRARVIARYEAHLLANPELLRQLPELRGKRIACFCAPKPCHGDVLKKYAEALDERTEALYSHALLVTGSRTWNDESRMRQALNDAWRAWGSSHITRPVLVSGHCPDGADAMAEGLWRAAGFKVIEFPADWVARGRGDGFRRNRAMVRALRWLHDNGARVRVTAFLDLCRRPGCAHQRQEQLMPSMPGHFSHGTVHCRQQALDAGLDVHDVVRPSLPPF